MLAIVGALHVALSRALVTRPVGTTDAPYGFVEASPRGAAHGHRPLVIVLHGAGSCGDGRDPASLVHRLPPLRDAALATLGLGHSRVLDEGAILLAPQSPGPWSPDALDRFVDYALRTYAIDPDRVYLTGLSMGGAGTWHYAAAHPERLAAAMPICPASIPAPDDAAQLEALPIRAYHAWDDTVVPTWHSSRWIAAIAARRGSDGSDPLRTYPLGTDATVVLREGELVWIAGTEVRADERLSLTELANGGHGIWMTVYDDAEPWEWLFAQRRGR